MLKELFFTITDNVTQDTIVSILDFYFSVKTEYEKTLIESALLSFFDATKMSKVSKVYREGSCVIIEFLDSLGENLVFVAGAGDCVSYTEHIYNLANLGIFGEIVEVEAVSLEKLKAHKILELKNEGSRLIQTINGKYYDNIAWLRKSQNYQDAIARYFPLSLYQRLPDEQYKILQESISVISRKDRYVVRINEVEDRINKADSLDELNAIDVQSQHTWEGLD